MSEQHHKDLELKEDFSGLTEVTVKESDAAPTQPPPKIDVSEAVAQAQAAQDQAQAAPTDPSPVSAAPDDESVPQLPGAARTHAIYRGMMTPPFRPPQRPSFWKTLLNRGLTILAVVAIGVVVWWWWSKNNSGGAGAVETVVETVKKTVEPIKKALKLPPLL